MPNRQSRPRLLMISHCLPQASGTPDERRAWDQLAAAGDKYDVWLLAAVDRPVNLRQWRALHAHTTELTLAAASLTTPLTKAVRLALQAWKVRTGFDAVFCTHRRLWWAAEAIDTPTRRCDTPTDLSDFRTLRTPRSAVPPPASLRRAA